MVDMPLPQILLQYGAITGQNVIQDSSIQTATLTILTNNPMLPSEAAEFIEKSLLLNGYAIIPAGKNTIKVVAVPASQGAPGSEGVPIYNEIGDLPETDQVVAFVMKFEHLGSEAAAAKLTEVFPAHTYGTIVPFPQASSVVITDSTAVIRRYAELQAHLDVAAKGVEIELEVFALDRANAVEVAEAIVELLELESSSSSQSGNEGSTRTTPAPTANPSPNGAATAVVGSQSADIQKVDPKIRADERTNSIIAIAESKDLDYIDKLISYFDAPAARRNFLKRPLKFVSVSTFLPIAQNALMPGIQLEGDGNITGGEAGANDQTTNSGGGGGISRSNQSTSGFGGSSSSGGSGGSSSLGSAQFSSDIGPQSLVIGKTLLIADNVHNTLIASGPEEHLEVIEELLDSMDQRPRQIQISAIIAQLTVGNDLQYGADLFHTIDPANFDQRLGGVLRNRNGGTPDIGSLTDVASFLPAAQGLTLYGQVDEFVNGYVEALHTKNKFRILSRPSVFTLNNRWASISTGQRIAVPSSTLSTLDPNNVNQAAVSSSISYEDVALEIRVLALINSEDEVTLLIEQINEDIIGSTNISGNDIPTIGSQKMSTTVIIPNGSTVLLGGLISEDHRKTDSGLPIMVSLPFVGPVFGTERKKDRQELLIFIQPKIVEHQSHLANAQEDFRMRSEFSKETLEFAAPKVTSKAAPKNLFKRIFQRKPKDEPSAAPLDPIFLKPEVKDGFSLKLPKP